MRHRKYPFIIGFLAAPVALYVTFVIYPFATAFYLSTTAWRGLDANPKSVGLYNFRRRQCYSGHEF